MSRAKPDTPMRLHTDLIERVNAHIKAKSVVVQGSKGKPVTKKDTISEFLMKCVDAFEMFKDADVYYCTELYKDLAEARGQAIIKAVKNKEAPKMPHKVVIVGKDHAGE